MPSFSIGSAARLASCHPDLIRLFTEVIKEWDCTVVEGHRGEEAQHEAYKSGHSRLDWPKGKHNKMPSLAIDVAPYPLDWQYTAGFYFFAGIVMATAFKLGIKIRWGGDWRMNGMLKANKFNDLVHFELVQPETLAGK